MDYSPYLEVTWRVLVFAFWSSFWPRRAVKARLEPLLGFRVYRVFYNIGTIWLLSWSYAYLVYKSPDTIKLWDLHDYAWFKPLIYALGALCIFFLTSLVQFGLSFWGIKKPPTDVKLYTNGFYKITRHPLYWAVFCLFLSHTLSMGTTLAVLYFVLIELYNVVAVIALENRGLARDFGPALKEFHARTSTLPFKSLIDGRSRLGADELPVRWLVGAAALTLLVASLHDVIILGTLQLLRPVMVFGGGG
jgi:uncharacterized membrane protein